MEAAAHIRRAGTVPRARTPVLPPLPSVIGPVRGAVALGPTAVPHAQMYRPPLADDHDEQIGDQQWPLDREPTASSADLGNVF
jgi:hypothetical protein